jgi:hypothetical protein
VFTAGAGTSTLAVHQVKGVERRCKFHVRLRGANLSDTADVEVDTFHGGIDQTIQLPTPAFAVASTQLDPFNECLVYAGTSARTFHVRPWRSERSL